MLFNGHSSGRARSQCAGHRYGHVVSARYHEQSRYKGRAVCRLFLVAIVSANSVLCCISAIVADSLLCCNTFALSAGRVLALRDKKQRAKEKQGAL